MSKHMVLIEYKQDGKVHSKIFEPWSFAVPSKGDFLLLEAGTEEAPSRLSLQVQRVSWTFLTNKSNHLRPELVEVVSRITCKVVS